MSEGKIDVHYPYGTTLLALPPVLVFCLLITHFNVVFVAGLAAFVVLFAIGSYWFNRLTADAAGVCITNYGFQERIAWDQIAGFDIAKSPGRHYTGPSRGLVIRLQDGGVRRPIGTRGGIDRYASQTGYTEDQVEQIVERLRSLRRKYLGVQDPPDLTAALESAESGNPEPLDHLLAIGRITSAEYTFRLHELAMAGRIDNDLLRRTRREKSHEL